MQIVTRIAFSVRRKINEKITNIFFKVIFNKKEKKSKE